MVNTPPSLHRSASTDTLQIRSTAQTDPLTQNQAPLPGSGILGVSQDTPSSTLTGSAQLPPLARNRVVAVSQNDESVHTAAHAAISRRNHAAAIASANSTIDRETVRRTAEQLTENVKKLGKFGNGTDENVEHGKEATNLSRLRLRLKLISEDSKSLASMLAELRNITENLETATLILSVKNLIRFLNDHADMTTSDHFAEVQHTVADKLDRFYLELFLKELLQEGLVRLQQQTGDTSESAAKLDLPSDPEFIDRV